MQSSCWNKGVDYTHGEMLQCLSSNTRHPVLYSTVLHCTDLTWPIVLHLICRDWLPRIDPDVFYFRFAGTLPTHHLYGLREAMEMILREGTRASTSTPRAAYRRGAAQLQCSASPVQVQEQEQCGVQCGVRFVSG